MNRSMFLIFACSVGVFGGVMFGFDIAIISGAIPFIQKYFSWDELQLGLGVSSLLVGCIIGSFSAGHLTYKFGRKRILIITAILFAISSIGTGLASNEMIFILNRLLGGLSVGAISVLSPMYVAEVAPAKLRGRMTSLYQLCIMLGILLSYSINFVLKDFENNWRLMFLSGVVPAAAFLIGLIFIPESPRWLITRGCKDDASVIINALYSEREAKSLTDELARSSNHPQNKNNNKVKLFNNDFRGSVILGLFLAISVQLIGCNAALDYAPKIMMSAGFSINSSLYFNIFMGCVNLLATILAVVLIDRVGRRPLYLFGSVVMGVSLICLGLSFHHFMPPMATLLFLFAYIAAFSACIGPVFWTLASEMFPNLIRSKAVALISFTQWIFNFLVVYLFPWALSYFGSSITFYFFAFICFIQFIVCLRALPETKGKSLEEIEEVWNKFNFKAGISKKVNNT